MKKQEIKIVLGFAFGDEGKGNTVQALCKQALKEGKSVAVVRYCGGAQAGHRVVHNGVSHVCSSFGSGVLLGVPTIYYGLYHNVLIDPIAMVNEYQSLLAKGINPKMPHFIDDDVCVTTPYDVIANQKDAKTLADGSCGKGINATIERYRKSENIYMSMVESIENAEEYYNSYNEDFHETFMMATDVIYGKHECVSLSDYDVLIFEGTQGLLLDADRGFNPHTTATRVGLNGIPDRYLTPETEVYLVTRTYLTRHGNGYEPYNSGITFALNIPEELTNLDTGFQGKFKVGYFDPNLLNRAIDRHCLDCYNVKYNLVLTHCDAITEEELIPYVDGYNDVWEVKKEDITGMLHLPFNKTIYIDSEDGSI